MWYWYWFGFGCFLLVGVVLGGFQSRYICFNFPEADITYPLSSPPRTASAVARHLRGGGCVFVLLFLLSLLLLLCYSAMDIEERIEIRADLIYTGILDAVERLKNQSVDVFMEKVGYDSLASRGGLCFEAASASLCAVSTLEHGWWW